MNKPIIEAKDGRRIEEFHNSLGERLIFVFDKGDDHATLYHVDFDWKPREVRGGGDNRLVFAVDERLWMEACWQSVMANVLTNQERHASLMATLGMIDDPLGFKR